MRTRALVAQNSVRAGSSIRISVNGILCQGDSHMKRYPQYQSNSKVTRSRDVSALSRLAMLLFCGLVLAGGFVFAGKNHFAAVQYGYQAESLRRERSQLLQQNQQLSLEKQRVSSPATLRRAGESLGLKPATAAQIGTPSTRENSKPEGGNANAKAKTVRTR